MEALAERIGSMADPAFLIQKVGAKGQPPQDLASGDDLPDAGAGPRFNTQTVDAAVRWQVPEDGHVPDLDLGSYIHRNEGIRG